MRHGTLLVLVFLSVTLSGCPGGGAAVGEPCDHHGDCASSLQCQHSVCVPRCERAPDCGDGYACSDDGLCQLATGQPGDTCQSEAECAPGLKCQINGTALDDRGDLLASCAEQNPGRPAGAECTIDADCRNGTCALGHCSDLCLETRDCAIGSACVSVPRVEAGGAPFHGCLAAEGAITWRIPVIRKSAELLLPVPSGARYASLVMSVDEPSERVGALGVVSPSGTQLYRLCPGADIMSCPPDQSLAQFYTNAVRHQPGIGMSVLAIPTAPDIELETGAYYISVSSLRAGNTTGSAIPTVQAVVRMDAASQLDLHFHFLNLADHPCEAFGGSALDAQAAQDEAYFQNDYLGHLREVFAASGIGLGAITYHDILDRPEFDGLDVNDVGALLRLGSHTDGIDVFFVRNLSPAGLQAYGPSPGPAGFAQTPLSGIVVGIDTLCYKSWETLARLTAHEIARYMGLYHNVEIGVAANPTWRDTILDSDDSPRNLMFYSDYGGTELSEGQRDILLRSPILR